MTNKCCWNGSGIDETILLKWKWDWWQSIADLAAGLMKKIGEMEVGLMKNIPEMEAGLMTKYCWYGSGIDENIFLKWKWDWWKIFLKWKWDWCLQCLHCSSCVPYSSCVQLQWWEIFQSSKAHKEYFKIDDCTR